MQDVMTEFHKDEKKTLTAGTIYQAFGTTNWTVAVGQPQKIHVTVSNLTEGILYIRRRVMTAAETLTGLVTTSDYNYQLAAGASDDYECAPGESLLFLTASTGDVRATSVRNVNNAS